MSHKNTFLVSAITQSNNSNNCLNILGREFKEKSAIGQHLQTCHTCDHNFNENQFNILSTGNSDFDCKIREALLNKSEKPTLNQHLFQNGSTFILCVFK